MPIAPIYGMPRITAVQRAKHLIVFRQLEYSTLAGGKVIDGSKTRDPLNGTTPQFCRAGTLMGLITASGKYASTILGVTAGAYTSGGTSVTVTAAQAVEIARRVGTSGTGTLKAIGPPAANGTVVATPITYSAIDTTTGVLTVTSLGVNKAAGTLITAADGSEVPITMLPDGFPRSMVDAAGASLDVPFEDIPIAGVVDSSKLAIWPSDTSIRQYIVDSLDANGRGKWIFDHLFAAP